MSIKTVGIAGTGLIGAGWAARLLIRGYDVIAYDVAPAAEAKLRAAIDIAWPSMIRLLNTPKVKKGKLSFTTDLKEMASKADFIHEAAPEREELKIRLFREIDSFARPDVIIASSSSGFLPTRLQSECAHPERVIIAHPFNPVYLLPLVETVPGEKTSPEAMDRAGKYFEGVGMHVLRLKKEIDGYICDRLQEALWREALHVLDKDIGTTADIDDSIVYSAGMRWAFMGSFLTYHAAGGPGGMRAFIKQFDPSLELPWTDLRYPKWNDALETRLVEGCEAQAGGLTVAEIEAKRNDVLVDMMHLFKQHKVGAGLVLAREEERRLKALKRWKKGAKIEGPLALHHGTVMTSWVDYNNHMQDAHYLVAFGDGLDAFLRYIGDDDAYRATGLTFFTAETHLNYYREMKAGEPFTIETQLVGADEKRVHLFHRMLHGKTQELVATNEIMQLHVDQKAGKVVPMRADIFEAVFAVWAAHKKLKAPAELGRVMGVPKKDNKKKPVAKKAAARKKPARKKKR
ncbi:3-hydroxyacyl-CoA dehydrogenase NAD-binding domain-containing protein [Taklimakanibacter deserti]|uniref:3-hydroxyacyl-CoA dehydrogenase NAD-binding domain-containing protein n=1 Tax=Taklimakanibacter deserti TaxID=2267839 RepID=UPI000E64A0CD